MTSSSYTCIMCCHVMLCSCVLSRRGAYTVQSRRGTYTAQSRHCAYTVHCTVYSHVVAQIIYSLAQFVSQLKYTIVPRHFVHCSTVYNVQFTVTPCYTDKLTKWKCAVVSLQVCLYPLKTSVFLMYIKITLTFVQFIE